LHIQSLSRHLLLLDAQWLLQYEFVGELLAALRLFLVYEFLDDAVEEDFGLATDASSAD
jgi:hypothetical protein